MFDIQHYASFIAAILVFQGPLMLAGNTLACRLAALPAARRPATRLGGLALIGLGLKLAFNNR